MEIYSLQNGENEVFIDMVENVEDKENYRIAIGSSSTGMMESVWLSEQDIIQLRNSLNNLIL